MSATRIYYTFSALLALGLSAHATVYGPFLLSIGLSLSEISLVNALFWIILIGAELPTGMIADGRSRAFSLKVGMALEGLGSLCYVFATGFWSAALAEGFIGIGMAFMSGAQQAWITDALAREGKIGQKRHVFATNAILCAVFTIVGGFIGALLALVSYRLTWTPLVLTSVIAVVFSHRQMNGQGEPMTRISEREALAHSWRHLLRSSSLKWLISSMILFGTIISFNHFWSPYFEPMVGTLGLSWIYAYMYLALMFSGWMIRRTTVPSGQESNMIVLALLLTGIGLTSITLFSGVVLPLLAVMIHEIGRGMYQPLTDSFVQHHVESSFRATFGSLQSFLGRLGFMIVPFIVWVAIDGTPDTSETIAMVWIVSGSLLVVGSVVCWFFRPRGVDDD